MVARAKASKESEKEQEVGAVAPVLPGVTKTTPPAETTASRLVTWTLVALVISGGLLGALLGHLIFPALGRALIPPTPSVAITQPHAGPVPLQVVVRGTYADLSRNQYTWLLVYPHETNSYYPQRPSISLFENGEWQGQVLIGREGEQDVGKTFDIIIALAGADAHHQLEQYMEQGALSGDYCGLDTLPDEVRLYDRVTVIRE